MKTTSRVVATLLAAPFFCGCPGAQEGNVQPVTGRSTEVHLTARDDDRRLEFRVGQRFTLELRANPSTGYSWEVASSGEPVIRQLAEPTFTEDSHMAGAGGMLRYQFRAERPGPASLKLVYVRPWEKDAAPADTFSLTVVVTK